MADEEHREPSEFIETASAIGGALAGTAVTFVAGPWAGSASGELVARVLLRVGSEIEHRWLGPRQERRIGEAAQAAFDEIGAQLDAGREVRRDGFFDPAMPDGESPADELFEGVLRTAADEWEQRKVPYVGRIFAGLSFDPSVSPADGTYLIKLAERLTYQQVVLLAFWEAARVSDRPYEQGVVALAVHRAEAGGSPSPTLLAEMDDLGSAGLLGVATNDEVVTPAATIGFPGAFGTFGRADLNTVRLTSMGQRLHRLMGLDHVPESDLEAILSALRGEHA